MLEALHKPLFDDDTDPKIRNLRKTLAGLGMWCTAGLLGVLSFAVSFLQVGKWYVHDLSTSAELLGYSIVVAIACLAVGGLFGFLFGIPRTVQTKGAGEDYRQEVNTNLEQISDWLTKILVGLGLTQLSKMPARIWSIADKLKPGLNNNQPFVACLMLNFTVCGFFAGYLLTRLFLAEAFSEADRAAILITQAKVAAQFTAAGQYKGAIDILENTLAAIDDNTPKSTKRDTYEKLTYNYLYRDPPEGFTRVIELGKKFVKSEPGTPSPKVWTNLALAFGQQYKWESEHAKQSEVLKEARGEALESIRKALALEPRMIGIFRMVWDPNDPTKISSAEDDLEAFYDDKDFQDTLMPTVR